MKKIDGNWHWLLPLLCFLSNNELVYSDHITEIKFIFQDSCLALNKFQKNNALKVIINNIKYLRK